MKINEKSLGKYALSGAPPDREGYLHKRGNFRNGYQKRWCVLKGNLLFYYEKKSDKEPVGKCSSCHIYFAISNSCKCKITATLVTVHM